MHHWVYFMRKSDSDPSKSGDMRSWFLYYRWEKDEEVYLPFDVIQASVLESKNSMPAAGDLLWLRLDDEAYGLVTISNVQEDFTNQRWEIWYHAGAVKAVPEDRRKCPELLGFHYGWALTDLTEEQHRAWEAVFHAKAN